MFIKRFKPSEILKPYIDSYVIFEDDCNFKDKAMNIVPNGVSEIGFHYGDPVNSYINSPGEIKSGYIYGPHNRKGFFTASGQVKCLAVLFKPWGPFRIFGIPQINIQNYAIELDDLCGSDGRQVIEEVMTANNPEKRIEAVENFFIRQLKRTKDSPIKIYEAIHLIQRKSGNIRIKDVSKKTQISIKTLERQFKDIVGYNPKEFANIIRLNHVYFLLQNSDEYDSQDIIYQCGYYDQSHFINDIKQFTGLAVNDFIMSPDKHVAFLNRMYIYPKEAF